MRNYYVGMMKDVTALSPSVFISPMWRVESPDASDAYSAFMTAKRSLRGFFSKGENLSALHDVVRDMHMKISRGYIACKDVFTREEDLSSVTFSLAGKSGISDLAPRVEKAWTIAGKKANRLATKLQMTYTFLTLIEELYVKANDSNPAVAAAAKKLLVKYEMRPKNRSTVEERVRREVRRILRESSST